MKSSSPQIKTRYVYSENGVVTMDDTLADFNAEWTEQKMEYMERWVDDDKWDDLPYPIYYVSKITLNSKQQPIFIEFTEASLYA